MHPVAESPGWHTRPHELWAGVCGAGSQPEGPGRGAHTLADRCPALSCPREVKKRSGNQLT